MTLIILLLTIYMGWQCLKNLPVNGFKWEDVLSRFNERFIKSYNENSNKGYFLEVDVEYLKKIFGSHKDLPFLPERKKLEKIEKLHSYESFETGTKSWIDTKKST